MIVDIKTHGEESCGMGSPVNLVLLETSAGKHDTSSFFSATSVEGSSTQSLLPRFKEFSDKACVELTAELLHLHCVRLLLGRALRWIFPILVRTAAMMKEEFAEFSSDDARYERTIVAACWALEESALDSTAICLEWNSH